MGDNCRWVSDKEVPGGRFLVPGCYNRALNGDYADCHCPKTKLTLQEQIDALKHEIEMLKQKAPTD